MNIRRQGSPKATGILPGLQGSSGNVRTAAVSSGRKKLPDEINANCRAHARRDFADAVKTMDKKDPSAVRTSVTYVALQKIAEFYNADIKLKTLSSKKRLQKRQEVIRPMVEDFFAWAKEQTARCAVPPKSKTDGGSTMYSIRKTI